MIRKASIYYPAAAAWLITDLLTKRWAVPFLSEHGGTHQVVGDYVRFTLAYNKGMAFGLSFGEWSRWILIGFTVLTLGLIFHLYRQTSEREKIQTFALALITGGALGNLVDRVMSARGVVDFIDVGIGASRFYIFNVADSGVSIGGLLLVLTMWKGTERDKQASPAELPPAA